MVNLIGYIFPIVRGLGVLLGALGAGLSAAPQPKKDEGPNWNNVFHKMSDVLEKGMDIHRLDMVRQDQERWIRDWQKNLPNRKMIYPNLAMPGQLMGSQVQLSHGLYDVGRIFRRF